MAGALPALAEPVALSRGSAHHAADVTSLPEHPASASTRAAHPIAEWTRAVTNPATAWLASGLRPGAPALTRAVAEGLLRRSGGGASAPTASGQDTFLLPVPDLTGDGRDDVLAYTLRMTQGSPRVTLGLLDGATGASRWQLSLPQGEYVLPWLEPVGNPARPGMLLVEQSSSSLALSFRALAGRGTPLWESSPAPTISGVPSVVAFDGLLTNRKGATDLLLSWAVSFGAGVGVDGAMESATVQRTQAGLLRGGDGALAPLGAPIDTVAYPPHVVGAPDLDGDGHQDLLVAVGAPNDGGSVQAWSSRTGSVLWRNDKVAVADVAYGAGTQLDAVGNRVADVLFTSWRMSSRTAGPPAGFTCSVLDGATGATGFSAYRPGLADCTMVPGGFGGRGQLRIDGVSGPGPSDAVVTFEDISPLSGQTRWRRELSAHGDPGSASVVSVFTSDFGDLQPDGWPEVSYALSFDGGGTQVQRFGILDGKTGRDLHYGEAGLLGGSLDGHGDDLVLLDHKPGRVRRVTEIDGSTGRSGATFAVTKPDTKHAIDVGLLSGRTSCAGLLLVTDYLTGSPNVTPTSLQAIDARTGRVVWASSPSGRRVAPMPVVMSGRPLPCR